MVTGIALTMKGEVSDQNDQCCEKSATLEEVVCSVYLCSFVSLQLCV